MTAVAVVVAATAAASTATQPVSRHEGWLQRHEGFLVEARRGGIEVVFLGDSITDLWRREGLTVWEKQFVPLRAANFGLDGDRTQHLLWRLQHGAVDGLSPKAVVVLIGTNNTGVERDTGLPRNSPDEAVGGIKAVVRVLREKLPEADILLVGLLPRGEPDSESRRQVTQINRTLAALEPDRRVHFVDIGARFLSADGTLSRDIMPDLLHLSAAGYALFADALRDPLARLLAARDGS